MSKVMLAMLAAVLTACGRPEPIDTVESLVANPERLRELRQRCHQERTKLGDELCNRVAEATNRRFFGNGATPYTPAKDSPKF